MTRPALTAAGFGLMFGSILAAADGSTGSMVFIGLLIGALLITLGLENADG